jgi:hypothetical protein
VFPGCGIGTGMEEQPKNRRNSWQQSQCDRCSKRACISATRPDAGIPKMKPYIYGPRNGIYIINLDITMKMFRKAYSSWSMTVSATAATVLFVGTKKQGQTIIREEAERCGMFFINHRWLGGMLTNFQTIRHSVDRLKKIEAMQADGSINRFPKKKCCRWRRNGSNWIAISVVSRICAPARRHVCHRSQKGRHCHWRSHQTRYPCDCPDRYQL